MPSPLARVLPSVPVLFAVATVAMGCAPAPVTPTVSVPPAPTAASAPPAPTATCSAVAENAPASPPEDVLKVEKGIPYFHGKVLHPGALNELGISLADSAPVDVAVDVDGVQASNKYSCRPVVRDHFVDCNDDEVLGKGGSFSYVYLGVTPGKTYAFETYFSGGGTGIYMNVLLVRFENQAMRRDDKIEHRWVMKRVGDITLGDRATGTVTLTGSTLTLGASQYRPKDVLIKLE